MSRKTALARVRRTRNVENAPLSVLNCESETQELRDITLSTTPEALGEGTQLLVVEILVWAPPNRLGRPYE
jgi:hypothetical protein